MHSRARVLIAAVAALAALSTVRLSAQPGTYGEFKLPHRLQWGPYTVITEKAGAGEFDPERLRIVDEGGAAVREVRDQRIVNVALQELDGAGGPELYVHTFSGGAHCCSTEYYFTREDGKVRNLLTFKGDNQALYGVKDLNKDGRPELIAGNDALAYFGGLSYAGSPGMRMIIGWNGEQYEDHTRRYPERAREDMKHYQGEFLKARTKRGEFAEEERRAAALGYWASALAIGEGDAAKRWLLARAPAATRRWMSQHEAELKKTLAAASQRKLVVDERKVLEPKEGC